MMLLHQLYGSTVGSLYEYRGFLANFAYDVIPIALF